MRTKMQATAFAVALAAAMILALSSEVSANTIDTQVGFTANTFGRCDDCFSGAVSLGFTANFFGTDYTNLFVNNNGNVTFNAGQSAFSPFGLATINNPIIAPFFADVDTRGVASGVTTWGTGTVNGDAALGVNWLNVGYFLSHTDKLNSFQLVLVNRSDVGAGDFDIYFNYGNILWETGDASGGSNGLGGDCAVVGYSDGSEIASPPHTVQLTGSQVCGAFLNGGPDALNIGTNDGNPGQFEFQVRNGSVTPPPVPEPSTLLMFGSGLLTIGGIVRRWLSL